MSENKVKVSLNLLAPIIENKISSGSTVEITVTGESMFPLFHSERDKVILAPITKLKRKKICFYKRENGSYVLHRIIKIKKDGIYCVGDNQVIIEGPLKPEQFIAEVQSFTRKGKFRKANSIWHKFYSCIWCANVSLRPIILRTLLKLKRKK